MLEGSDLTNHIFFCDKDVGAVNVVSGQKKRKDAVTHAADEANKGGMVVMAKSPCYVLRSDQDEREENPKIFWIRGDGSKLRSRQKAD